MRTMCADPVVSLDERASFSEFSAADSLGDYGFIAVSCRAAEGHGGVLKYAMSNKQLQRSSLFISNPQFRKYWGHL
jgi:hypothetical protein